HAVPGRSGHGRHGRRHRRPGTGLDRPVGGTPAAGQLRRAGAPRPGDAADELRPGRGRQPAGRPRPCLAGDAGDARDPAQEPVVHRPHDDRTHDPANASIEEPTMELRPILSTLLRHKTTAVLIVLEIALSCAIICNALFLIGNRIERINQPSGVAEDEIVRVQLAGIGTGEDDDALTRSDLAVLRGLPGVKAATVINQVPFVHSSWNSGVKLSRDQKRSTLNATQYMAESQFLDTMGLRLVAGRDFVADEFQQFSVLSAPGAKVSIPSTIITRSMADKLFPGQDAIGKSFYVGQDAIRVVGVVDHLVRPGNNGGPVAREYSMIFPINTPYSKGGNYLLRTDPARRAEVLKAALAALERNGPNRIILTDNTKTMTELRSDFYRQDRAMVWLLVAVIVALLVVTALGIVGLASFWVQQRTKQIGV